MRLSKATARGENVPRHILFWVSREKLPVFLRRCISSFVLEVLFQFFKFPCIFRGNCGWLEWILSCGTAAFLRSAARRDYVPLTSRQAVPQISAERFQMDSVRSFRLSSFPSAFAFNSSRLTLERSRMESAADPVFPDQGHTGSRFFLDGFELCTGLFPGSLYSFR